MLESRDVAGHLGDVVERRPWSLFDLEEQQIRERRLGALDLGGEDRFLADVGVEKEGRVGEHVGHTVESTGSDQCQVEGALKRDADFERRRGREWTGNEGSHLLAACSGDDRPLTR
jgi:hypothetical protein